MLWDSSLGGVEYSGGISPRYEGIAAHKLLTFQRVFGISTGLVRNGTDREKACPGRDGSRPARGSNGGTGGGETCCPATESHQRGMPRLPCRQRAERGGGRSG